MVGETTSTEPIIKVPAPEGGGGEWCVELGTVAVVVVVVVHVLAARARQAQRGHGHAVQADERHAVRPPLLHQPPLPTAPPLSRPQL